MYVGGTPRRWELPSSDLCSNFWTKGIDKQRYRTLGAVGAISADDLKFWEYWPRLKAKLADIQGQGGYLLGWIVTYSGIIRYEQSTDNPDYAKINLIQAGINQARADYDEWANNIKPKLDRYLPTWMQIDAGGMPPSSTVGWIPLAILGAAAVGALVAAVYAYESHIRLVARQADRDQLIQAYISGRIDSPQLQAGLQDLAATAAVDASALDQAVAAVGGGIGSGISSVLIIGGIAAAAYFLLPRFMGARA